MGTEIHWLADFCWLVAGVNLFVIVSTIIRYFRSEPEPDTFEQHLEDLEQQAYLARLKRTV